MAAVGEHQPRRAVVHRLPAQAVAHVGGAHGEHHQAGLAGEVQPQRLTQLRGSGKVNEPVLEVDRHLRKGAGLPGGLEGGAGDDFVDEVRILHRVGVPIVPGGRLSPRGGTAQSLYRVASTV